jgi:hypothetical protein
MSVAIGISQRKYLSLKDATNFFSELFNGEHHIPGKIKKWGTGWEVNCRYPSFATFDYSYLTKLVIMAHDKCIRAEIMPSGPGMLKICIWQRQGREGKILERHPTIEQAIESFRGIKQ